MGIPKRQKAIEGRFANVDGIAYKMPVDSWEAAIDSPVSAGLSGFVGFFFLAPRAVIQRMKSLT